MNEYIKEYKHFVSGNGLDTIEEITVRDGKELRNSYRFSDKGLVFLGGNIRKKNPTIASIVSLLNKGLQYEQSKKRDEELKILNEKNKKHGEIIMHNIYHLETLIDGELNFEIQFSHGATETSLIFKSEDADGVWENGDFIANTIYPQLRGYLVDDSRMQFEGAKIFYKYDRYQLFNLYDLLSNAIYRGWLEVKDK